MQVNIVESNSYKNSCTICGQAPITRRRCGELYCSRCYNQWFSKKLCIKCEEWKRIHYDDELCRACEIKQPCIRCSKDSGTFVIGKITKYGVVCNSCYTYFRDEKECFECGRLSKKVSRSSDASHNQLLCLSCYRKYNFITCKNCRRYRKIGNKALKLCKKCDEQLLSICTKCKTNMPSGYGSICIECSKRKLLSNLVHVNKHLFYSEAIQRAYKRFIFWYIKMRGVSVVLKESNKFISFFIECDKKWQSIPSYIRLVKYFSPNGLRGNLTVLRWLIDTNQIVVSLEIKDEISEYLRIQKLLDKLPKSIYFISSYHEHLQKKYIDGLTSLKSIRLALQPAVDLVVSSKTLDIPNQAQLDSYLLDKIGQISAVTGFINHLNNKYNQKLNINRQFLQKMKKLKWTKYYHKRLVELHKKKYLTKNEKIELIRATLFCLYSIFVNKVQMDQIVNDVYKDYYYFNGREYFLPKDIMIRIKFL